MGKCLIEHISLLPENLGIPLAFYALPGARKAEFVAQDGWALHEVGVLQPFLAAGAAKHSLLLLLAGRCRSHRRRRALLGCHGGSRVLRGGDGQRRRGGGAAVAAAVGAQLMEEGATPLLLWVLYSVLLLLVVESVLLGSRPCWQRLLRAVGGSGRDGGGRLGVACHSISNIV
jgi:hypothetical protein